MATRDPDHSAPMSLMQADNDNDRYIPGYSSSNPICPEIIAKMLVVIK